jgi:hypothetical protein
LSTLLAGGLLACCGLLFLYKLFREPSPEKQQRHDS